MSLTSAAARRHVFRTPTDLVVRQERPKLADSEKGHLIGELCGVDVCARGRTGRGAVRQAGNAAIILVA